MVLLAACFLFCYYSTGCYIENNRLTHVLQIADRNTYS